MHGFHNNGNTCYFNSAVQCLLHIPGLSDRLLQENVTDPFTVAYRELGRLYFGEQRILKIDILPLLRVFRQKFPSFDTMWPHDAQETIFCIMDVLDPYVKDIVYGEREQHTVWPGGRKVTKEPFSVLMLHGEHDKTVDELVRKSEEWHTLDGYEDDDGKTHHVATTRTSITRFPRVLFVSFDKKTRVTAGDVLEKYEVKGSIIHVGGHYMSMIKLGDKWILQDDTTLTQVDFPETSTHHVLMYTLKTPPS
jgi:uncharacterized UBP type Zn finger protein